MKVSVDLPYLDRVSAWTSWHCGLFALCGCAESQAGRSRLTNLVCSSASSAITLRSSVSGRQRNHSKMSAVDDPSVNDNLHVDPQQHSQLHLGGNEHHAQMGQPQQQSQQQPSMTIVSPQQGDLSGRKGG